MQRVAALVAIGGTLALATPAAAEMLGGSVGLSHSFFLGDTDISKTALEGSLEFGITPQFSIQGDLSGNRFGLSNATLSNGTLHATFHPGDSTAIGAFLGFDTIEGDSATLYGIEAKLAPGPQTGVEGYLARLDDGGTNATQFGLAGTYRMTDQVGFGTRFDYGDGQFGDSTTRFAISADFGVTPNAAISAELGRVDNDAFGFGGNEAYVKLGGKITFGPNNGTTFGLRSIANVIPGL